ncbi:MAG: outer membrane beta-barrel protein [Acidobacteriia bacterium]|nr:outer membrane beta-barrel protein [Terriglobia bacterium]
MREASLLFFVLIFLSAAALAQSTPWWELYGGYQYTRADTSAAQDEVNLITDSNGLPHVDIGRHQNMNGWNVSLQENKASWWGGVVDFSGSYKSKDVDLTQIALAAGLIQPGQTATARLKPSVYTFAGGPQFAYRRKRIQPFARMMFGVAHARARADLLVNKAIVLTSPEQTDTAFALIGGGGADYVWKDSLAFRVVGDYVRTYLFSETQSNFRISVGVNFRIGRK